MNLDLVAAVIEPSGRVRRRERRESFRHRFEESVVGARSHFAKDVLYLGERFFDEPTTVRLYTRASSSGYTIILSSQLDPLPVSMVSARQFMQPAKPFELRFVGPHYPASSVTGRLPAADPSPTNPRI